MRHSIRHRAVHALTSRLAIAPATAAALLAIALAPAASAQQLAARVDSMIRAEVTTGPLAGVAAAAVRGRDTLVMQGWGYADVENATPVTPATVFRIGSITKQFTSALVMRLVERGTLSLDDTLGKLVPNVPPLWRRVTLRQLLNHTSGIHNYTASRKWLPRWREDMSPDTIVSLVRDDTLDFAPGTKWSYDNTGYVLLGMVLDRATHVPYPTLVHDSLVAPLGLAATEYCWERPIIPHRAAGYDRVGKGLLNTQYLSMTQPYAAGALCSTVGDLLRWTAALSSGRVVSAASYATMTRPTGAAMGSHYGFGLVVDTMGGHRRIHHDGGINGFISSLDYYPDDSLTVVVLSNTAPAPTSVIAGNIARMVFGLPLVGTPLPVVTLTGEERARYLGTYRISTPGGAPLVMHIRESGHGLVAQAEGPGQGTVPLIAHGDHTFGADFDRTLKLTFTVEKGRATKLTLEQGGAVMQGVLVSDP